MRRADLCGRSSWGNQSALVWAEMIFNFMGPCFAILPVCHFASICHSASICLPQGSLWLARHQRRCLAGGRVEICGHLADRQCVLWRAGHCV